LAGIECLPWDYWGPARRFAKTRAVDDDDARLIDALAEATDPAPNDREQSAAILDCFPWARPTETVRSFVRNAPLEVAILPA
jgi:hypothetical protein